MLKYLPIVFGKNVSWFVYLSGMVLIAMPLTLVQFLVSLACVIAIDMFYFFKLQKYRNAAIHTRIDKAISEVKEEIARRKRDTHDK